MGELNTKMTALADEVRKLGGTQDMLGIATMTDTLTSTNDIIDTQANLITELRTKVNSLPTNSHDIFLLREATSYTNNTITKIGRGAFYDWVSLESVSLPKVTEIGASAFNACAALQNVNMPRVTFIDNAAFKSCTALESISLPELQSVQSAFGYCSNLKHINFPKLIQIDNGTFYPCVSLESIEFPKTFRSILRNNCFRGCTVLTKIVLPYEGVVSLANISNFIDTPFANGEGHIYVHPDYVNAYKTATNWSTYANVITSMEEMYDEQTN